jgi:hypothetical protein
VVDARDRLRVDLVAEVGGGGLAAGDEGVRDGLERRVREVHGRLRGIDRRKDPLGRRQRRQHEAAQSQDGGAPEHLAAREQLLQLGRRLRYGDVTQFPDPSPLISDAYS